MKIRNHLLARDDGRSSWGSLSGLNRYSNGIELDPAGCQVKRGGKWVSPPTRRSYPDSEVTGAPTKTTRPAQRHQAGPTVNISPLSALEFASACLPIQTGE